MNPSTQAIYGTAVRGVYLLYAANGGAVNLARIRQITSDLAHKRGRTMVNFNRGAVEALISFVVNRRYREEIKREDLRDELVRRRDHAFILVLADTGLRISEACALRRGSIDYDNARAFVIGKGNNQALIRFSSRSLAAIRFYLAARAGLDIATAKPAASLPLFSRHDRGSGQKIKAVQSHGMWAAVKEVMVEAGLDPSTVRIHDLRHYFVTMVYRDTRDIKTTQVLARHASIGTTDRYTHLDGELDETYNRVFNRKP